ncbi:protelomerase family protein [Endozoicomonas sp.]|uniref:protelomerase family protein n=1 Tax=Endozoicomonas sp. TaxID=1892382 RepID=UPI002884CE42|nr:protelomerase family protein [Endozoicomonas sp.]
MMMDVKNSRLEKTHELVQYLVNMDSKNPTNSINKKVARELKKLGITMVSTRSKLANGNWITDYEKTDNGVSINTAKEVIRNYKNAILALEYINHNYEKNMEYLKDEILEALGGSEDVLALFNYDDIEGIRTALKKLYRTHSKKAKNSKVKIVLNSIQPEHHAYYKFNGATIMLSKIINDEAPDVLRKKHDNRIRVNPDFIIELAHKTLLNKSASWQAKAAALIVVTGRRPTEILKTGSLDKLKGNNALFDGQLKTRDRGLHEDLGAYPIPLIASDTCTASHIIKTMQQVQKTVSSVNVEFPNMLGVPVVAAIGDPEHGKNDIAHNRGVTQYSNRMINDVYSSWLDMKGVTCKSMRAMYSTLAYQINKPTLQKGISEDAYTTSILGYGEHGFGASRNYKQIELDRSIEKAQAPEADPEDIDKKLIKLLEKKTEDVLANKRAKATHILHSTLIAMAKSGHLKTAEMTSGRLSRIPVSGKRININTVQGYLERIGITEAESDSEKETESED